MPDLFGIAVDPSPLTRYLKQLGKDLATAVNEFPQARALQLDHTVRNYIMHNHWLLGNGGVVPLPGGGGYSWTMMRHSRTLRIRKRMGRGPRPMLTLTGKLQTALASGRIIAEGHGRAKWAIPGGNGQRLVMVHELGLAPLPAYATVRGGRRVKLRPYVNRVPRRQSLFWSRPMADDVAAQLVEYATYRSKIGRGKNTKIIR